MGRWASYAVLGREGRQAHVQRRVTGGLAEGIRKQLCRIGKTVAAPDRQAAERLRCGAKRERRLGRKAHAGKTGDYPEDEQDPERGRIETEDRRVAEGRLLPAASYHQRLLPGRPEQHFFSVGAQTIARPASDGCVVGARADRPLALQKNQGQWHKTGRSIGVDGETLTSNRRGGGARQPLPQPRSRWRKTFRDFVHSVLATDHLSVTPIGPRTGLEPSLGLT